MRTVLALAAALMAGVAGAAQAQTSVTVSNAGFEDPVLGEAGFTNGAAGWTAVGGFTYNPGASEGISPVSGNNIAGFASANESFEQATSELVQAGGVYTLTVNVGKRTGYTLRGSTISLWDGDSMLSQLAGPSSLSDGAWSPVELVYVGSASDAGNLRIRIAGSSENTINTHVYFDDVALTALVPEPTSLALLGFGVAGLLRRRR